MFARPPFAVAALAALVALLLTTAASAAPVPFGGHTYDLVLDDQITWTGARDAAAASGGSLAVISSAQEQSFLEGLLFDRNAPTGSYWFGLQEGATEGIYSPLD